METENTGDCTMEQAIMKIQLKERDEKIAKLEREKKEIILLIDEESGHVSMQFLSLHSIVI